MVIGGQGGEVGLPEVDMIVMKKGEYPQYSPEITTKVANRPACLWSFEHDVQIKLVRSGLHLQIVVEGSSVEYLSVHFSEVA